MFVDQLYSQLEIIMNSIQSQEALLSESILPRTDRAELQIGIIGCGYWGPNHVRNFSSTPGCKVAAVADLESSRLVKISEHFPTVRLNREYKEILSDPDIHAVVIATPTSTHYSVVRDALLAGKHVLCEKPLCQDSRQGEELVELAEERQLTLMVGHVFLFNSAVSKLKHLLESGEIGRVYYLSSVRTNLGPIRSDVNAAYDLAAHDISIFNWLLDSEPMMISATGACCLRPGIEDFVFISLRYPGNIYASVQASWLNPKKVRGLTIVGSKKMVTWDDLELNSPVAIYDRGALAKQEYNDFGEFLRISMWNGDVRLPRVEVDEPLKVQSREFVRAIREKTPHRSDGRFGLGVVQALEAVRQSLYLNGAPVLTASHKASPTVEPVSIETAS
jgi:predicted dehydrogenase